MNDEMLFDIERSAFASLQQLVVDRAQSEAAIAEALSSAMENADREVQRARRTIAASRKKASDEWETERDADADDRTSRFDLETAKVEQLFNETKSKTEQQYRVAEAKLKSDLKDRLWTIDSMHEAGEKENDTLRDAHGRISKDAEAQIEDYWEQAESQLALFNIKLEQIAFRSDRLPPPIPTDPEGKLEKCLEDVQDASEKLKNCTMPKFVGLWGTVWCVFVAGGISAAIAALMSWSLQTILGVGIIGAVIGGLTLRQILWFFARKQVRDRGSSLGVFLSEAERALQRFSKFAEMRHADAKTELHRKQLAERKESNDAYLPKIAGVSQQGRGAIAKLENDRATKLTAISTARTKAEREARMLFSGKNRELTKLHDEQLEEAETRFSAKCAEGEAERDAAWNSLSERWFSGLKTVQQKCDTLEKHSGIFPNWSAFALAEQSLAENVPFGIRFGNYTVDQLALPDGTPSDPRLMPDAPIQREVPAYLPFPDRAAVLYKARDAGRNATIRALQAAMLRYLTGLPAGKVRFTIIDPVGLGENFAAFMHLADYDEQLVSSRIWTEPSHIEDRLTDLTEHMENVIQKYLRNQYASIEAYNRAAGEVAEPYRVLVIANFPTNFTTEAARRLVSIMNSGPACGVCTLLGVDSAASMPRDFRLADLEQVAFNLRWKEDHFAPTDAAFVPFPLALDAPPPPTELANIVKRIGEASRSAKRVEVPFEYIAPAPEMIWKGTTKKGIEVPIGRAGATRKQLLTLGQGTAQHALVAGKTGSGKSTLLHALITNIAMIYSPDEAELYLIDFKKGVEFKMYAANQLPHARVIAIESEREFGISVLQRLDGILRERGEKYRVVGANDVSSYREAKPEEHFPRILLVVDEFQEFFVEDDKLAQEASLLLDRLVRQGRAFGVHVLLGSQTLGGAYSIPRATIDQMAVRIALQCSEADAQMILNKDNTAARLLSRPGDAIYNDANGMLEGNDPFQVVWLSDDQRETILQELHARGAGKHYPKPLVFEGSSVAELQHSRSLMQLAQQPSPSGPIATWLGDAIAIKEPTSALFRAQSGSHLLLLGQQEEAAFGIEAAVLTAIVARMRPKNSGARSILVLDGTPDDSPHADTLRNICGALDIANGVVERSELSTAMSELSAEYERRQKGETPDRSPRFLIVQGLQRFRELRKADDDFGFGKRGETAASPASQFGTLLREGPAFGIHFVIWCDTLTNLTRALDRQALREFHLRVLFQMSANDSSQLIDSPAANKLDRHRALFIEDGQERPEKFRPYGLPDLEWLRQFVQQLPEPQSLTPA